MFAQFEEGRPDEITVVNGLEMPATEVEKKLTEVTGGQATSVTDLPQALIAKRPRSLAVVPNSIVRATRFQRFVNRLSDRIGEADPRYYKALFVVLRLASAFHSTQFSVSRISTDPALWKQLVNSSFAAGMSGGLQAANGRFMEWLDRNELFDRAWTGLLKRAEAQSPVVSVILARLAAGGLRLNPVARKTLLGETEGLLKLLVFIEVPYISVLKSVMLATGLEPYHGVQSAAVSVLLSSAAAMYFQGPVEKAIASDYTLVAAKNPRLRPLARFVADLSMLTVSFTTTALATAALMDWPYAYPALLATGTTGIFYYLSSVYRRYRAGCLTEFESRPH